MTPLRARAVDDQKLDAGPITLQLQQAYWDTVRGRNGCHTEWLDYPQSAPVTA